MEFLNISFFILILSTLAISFLLVFVLKRNSNQQIQKVFATVLSCVIVICLGVIAQSIASNLFKINPIYFEPFIYIGTSFLPVMIFFMSLSFTRTKIQFKKRYLLLFLIPFTTLLILITNDFHHLFYVKYSTNLSQMVYGWYLYVHIIYTYGLFILSIFMILKYILKNSGFFSKQFLLILIGTIIPIVVNLLGTLKIINMNIYLTPISFAITLCFYALAIFKFKFLSVTPIALQRIVDRISDSYIVLNEDFIITDFNKTLLTTFHLKDNELRNKNIFDIILKLKEKNINTTKLKKSLEVVKNSSKTIHYEIHLEGVNKYFNVEINDIKSKNTFLGILILLKDITQHKEDMETIKESENLLMERERLASLGQLIGGIAHNLKTPIMSIAGAAEGLHDLTTEYEESIGDPEVTVDDHHAISHEMSEWIEKIKTHTSYMSDIITAVKGQAVVLSEEDQNTFDIDELIKRVNILMKHELKNALIDLNIHLKVNDKLVITGNVNSLVQVINNMISNAIQAYNGQTNKVIDLTISSENDKLIISIQDYGCGMNQKIKDKLFKEMITTKGKNGTGLGLFMSHSTIRAHFNGNITFESEERKGTTFNIILPL